MDSVGRLAGLPRLGRPGRVEGTRELVVPNTPYIVAYAIIEDRVAILSVLHSARRWPDRF
jgi:toxin ParE1/3/4